MLDAPVGTQSRTATVSKLPVGDGDKCPDPEQKTCPVDCVYSWTQWSDCDENGEQVRSPYVSTACYGTDLVSSLVTELDPPLFCRGACWLGC